MESILTAAETILHHHPAPALRIRHLLRRLVASGAHRRLTADRLRTLLARDPGRFRVLEVWTGPWRALRGPSAPGELAHDCWIAAIGPAPRPPGPRVTGRMRESVRWLAHRLDPRYRHEVLRWHRLVLAEEATRGALGRGAA